MARTPTTLADARVSWQARLLTRLLPRMVSAGVRDGATPLSDIPALRARTERLARPGAIVSHVWGPRVRRHPDAGVAGEWTEPVRASGVSPPGVVLYLHGGAFAFGSPATHRAVTTSLARLSGLPVLSLDYRLAPEHPFPCALDDAVHAYRTLLARGIPPWSIVLAGDSAGGNLALATLVALRDAKTDLPACGILFSPWADLRHATQRDSGALPLSQAAMAMATRLYIGDTPEPLASPALADLHGLPPLQIHVSDAESIYRDARALASRLRRAGSAAELSIWHAMPHAWPCFAPFLPEARAALRQAATFIRRSTGLASTR
ncbi:alpha/beta hydrolase [Cupriavidus plantarum]|uniref:alpha/beta hydrolase n=2 Tax=Cupriavidus plantarum TaxID=942865 RepID=UPI00339D9368